MKTNLDAQYLENLIALIQRNEPLPADAVPRLQAAADHLQSLDEKLAARQPDDYALGFSAALTRLHSRANVKPEGIEARALADAIARAPVTRVPTGARALDPVTRRPWATAEGRADPVPRKRRRPKAVDKLLEGLDLSDFQL